MKQNFYKITASNRFQAVVAFLRKELGWKTNDALFTYINLSFAPSPDDTVSNLYKVRLLADLIYSLLMPRAVFSNRRPFDRKLQVDLLLCDG